MMNPNEEVPSDDGSYEFIDFDDYASEMEHHNMEGDVSSNTDSSDDDSYDMLSSKVSEDCPEEDEEDSTSIDFSDSVYMSTDRNIMTMVYQYSNFGVFDYPAHIRLQNDIREVAKNHILRYLPAKSLARLQLVSRAWDQWISSPFFSHMQSQYFRKTSGFFEDEDGAIRFISLYKSAYGVPNPSLCFLPRGVFIRSSCNGLLLCQSYDDENKYYICNPAKKEWIRLPRSIYYHGNKPKIVLAIEPSSLNFEPCYQVVCPFSLPDFNEGPIVYFEIYDSRTQSWRTSDTICVDLDESSIKDDGIFVDGIVYWETTGGELLAFDLKNEIYGVQALPSIEGGAFSKVLGEFSYLKAYYEHSTTKCVLNVYGGGMMSLKHTMAFGVSFVGLEDGEIVDCRVVANSCDDMVAVILKKSRGPNSLYVYHVKDKKVEGPWFLRSDSNVFPYINNLMSIANGNPSSSII